MAKEQKRDVEKFKFVTMEDLEKGEEAKREKESASNFVVPVRETFKKRMKKKFYFSFEARVTTMIICVAIMFLAACALIVEAIKSGSSETISYSEKTESGYYVCLDKNDFYSTDCLNEDMQYVSSLTDTVNVYFQYFSSFSDEITYDLSYHIDAIMRVYDKENNEKILYKSEDHLSEKETLKGTSKQISFDTDVILKYQDYAFNAATYIKRYQLNAKSEVEIVLYLDDKKESRNIASITVPLGEETYSVKKNNLHHSGSVVVKGDFWNHYNAICAIFASILIFLSLFLLYRTTKLVRKVTTNHTQYQKTLRKILREYDPLIVIARDGYESLEEKPIVKVEEFQELLDAREILQKPIIYTRVNNIKSEFVVEDDDKLYQYVLKEKE